MARNSAIFEARCRVFVSGHDSAASDIRRSATDGNPLDDITAVRRVVFVMWAGHVVRKDP